MLYPERLVPQPFFKLIDFNQANTSLGYLIRFTDTRNILDDQDYLREELISTHESYNHLRDFSTYLLGIFTIEDIQWVWEKDTPLRANFWHCSLRWYCNEQGSEEWNKGRMRRMKKYIRDFIVENALIEEPLYQSVDPSHYTAIPD